MKRFFLLIPLFFALAACSAQPTQPVATQRVPTSTAPSESAQTPPNELTRVDQQGMVVVEVLPVDLESPGETITFDITLNTHSIDLSMDLAPLSTVTTDSGFSVQATVWDAPLGGHHVSGQLIFPATQDGAPILQGASTLTLTIIDLDAPARTFEWQLQ